MTDDDITTLDKRTINNTLVILNSITSRTNAEYMNTYAETYLSRHQDIYTTLSRSSTERLSPNSTYLIFCLSVHLSQKIRPLLTDSSRTHWWSLHLATGDARNTVSYMPNSKILKWSCVTSSLACYFDQPPRAIKEDTNSGKYPSRCHTTLARDNIWPHLLLILDLSSSAVWHICHAERATLRMMIVTLWRGDLIIWYLLFR